MYSEVVETADATLTTNRRVRAAAAALRVETRFLLIRYRSHRFPELCGASDAHDGESVRQRLSDVRLAGETPKTFVGFSRGSVCEVCGSVIEPGQLEYDLVTSTSSLRVDTACYGTFSETSRAEVDEDSAKADDG